MKKNAFSGVQPSGIPTIGNYIGAMKGFVDLQHEYNTTYCVVDEHAMTVPSNLQHLKQRTRELAALYLAIGIDPNESTIFVQSDVPAHTQASWLVTTLLGIGELERMTQYKDKSSKQESVGAGLLMYPALMVADIILYNSHVVPVGEDQRQHIELTRDFVDRFNSRFGKGKSLLIKPEPLYPKAGARIMSLQDPTSKMSKSDTNPRGFISLLDTPKQIEKKIKSAVTDSVGEVNYDKENQPAIANLLEIYSSVSNRGIDELVKEYHSLGYGKFKQDIADSVVATIEPIQHRFNQLVDSDDLTQILKEGAIKADRQAQEVLQLMKDSMGIGY